MTCTVVNSDPTNPTWVQIKFMQTLSLSVTMLNNSKPGKKGQIQKIQSACTLIVADECAQI